MAYQERRIVYRQQMKTADQNTGIVRREIMQACYVVVMVNRETGEIIVTNKNGIVDIPLAKYPELQADVESFVPKFNDAFEIEYQLQQNQRFLELSEATIDPNSLLSSNRESTTSETVSGEG